MPASEASEWFQIQFRFSLEIFIDRKRFSVLLHQKRFLAKKGIWVEVSKNHPKNCSVSLWNRSWSSLDRQRLKIKWMLCRNQFPSETNRKSFSNYQLTCDAKTSCRSFFFSIARPCACCLLSSSNRLHGWDFSPRYSCSSGSCSNLWIMVPRDTGVARFHNQERKIS